MRERTTWNRTVVAQNLKKVADDPRAMNQDHIQQQPAADAYDIGGPSEFAEDLHPSAKGWKADLGSDGNTRRNEIGMPEIRRETFSPAEHAPGESPKRASEQEDEVEEIAKKAHLATRVARLMLKNASEDMIEDQALGLMHLSNTNLTETYERLAQQDPSKSQQDQAQQDKEAQSQQDQGDQSQQDKEAKKAQQDQADAQAQQDKEAGKVPPQFLENIKKMKDKADDKKDDDKGKDKEAQAQDDQSQQDKEAQSQQDQGDQSQQDKEAQAQQADQNQDKEASNAARAAALSLVSIPEGPARTAALHAVASSIFTSRWASMCQHSQQQQLSQEQVQSQQQQLLSQIQQMVQTAVQQQSQPQQQQVAQGQQPQQVAQMTDEQLVDQMFQQPGQGQDVFAESDIQLDTPNMDVGDVQLTAADNDILGSIFNSNPEVQHALAAQALTSGMPHLAAAAPMTRTASTRTVGTRPTAGVSQLGAVGQPTQGSDDISKLSSLWNTAPDVSKSF